MQFLVSYNYSFFELVRTLLDDLLNPNPNLTLKGKTELVSNRIVV